MEKQNKKEAYHLPLSDEEIDKIEKGEYIIKHWHDGENKIVVGLIHNGHLSHDDVERKTKGVVASGDNVINIELTKLAFEHLKVGAHKIGYDDDIVVLIYNERLFKEHKKDG